MGKNKKNKATRQSRLVAVVPRPPSFVSTFSGSNKRLRFTVSTAFQNRVFYMADLLDLICTATSATAAYRSLAAVRLRKIEMWNVPYTSTPSTVSVEWSPFAASVAFMPGGRSQIVSDTSMSPSITAHIATRPPKGSLSDMWQMSANTGTVILCELSAPIGTVIDLFIDYSFLDSTTNEIASVTTAVAGATTGAMYCRDLFSSQGTTTVPPVSLPTI